MNVPSYIRRIIMKPMSAIVLICVLSGLVACAAKPEKPKPRMPLPLAMSAPSAAVQVNDQGARAYQSGQFTEAKTYFTQTVASVPDSGEAHYNLGLALYALGETEQAREEFVEAANLAPGNKVIWDSPALRQYGNPDATMQKKKGNQDYTNQKPGLGVKPGGMSR
jgi:tetratricopeptide (TPR) repeat protein